MKNYYLIADFPTFYQAFKYAIVSSNERTIVYLRSSVNKYGHRFTRVTVYYG